MSTYLVARGGPNLPNAATGNMLNLQGIEAPLPSAGAEPVCGFYFRRPLMNTDVRYANEVKKVP